MFSPGATWEGAHWVAAALQPVPGEMEQLEKKCLAVYCLPIVVMDRRAEAFSEAELWPQSRQLHGSAAVPSSG